VDQLKTHTVLMEMVMVIRVSPYTVVISQLRPQHQFLCQRLLLPCLQQRFPAQRLSHRCHTIPSEKTGIAGISRHGTLPMRSISQQVDQLKTHTDLMATTMAIRVNRYTDPVEPEK
jgi:hypothetical protein